MPSSSHNAWPRLAQRMVRTKNGHDVSASLSCSTSGTQTNILKARGAVRVNDEAAPALSLT
jgi:hypothetical protein